MTSAPSALTDGLGVTIDDGSGPLRIVVADAALGGATVGTGDVVTATGPLGQRDSSGTGTRRLSDPRDAARGVHGGAGPDADALAHARPA